MARESMRGISQEKEIWKLLLKIRGNTGYLDKNDIEVLRHLSVKGLYDPKKAVLIDNNEA